MCGLEVQALTAEHLDDARRLHKFSSTAGGAVFGSSLDISGVLAAAAQQQDG
jgi:hypothetical protein